MIDDSIRADKQKSQYGVNRVPVHSHNGLDSPKIDFGGAVSNRQVFVTSRIPDTGAATSGNYGQFFLNPLFISPTTVLPIFQGGMTILTMSEVHGRAGNDGSAVSVGVYILNPGDASISGGTLVHSFDLKSTANVPRYSSLILGATPAVLYPGQRLALHTTGTLTNVADVLVTIYMQY